MLSLNETRRLARQFSINPRSLWASVLMVAVTSNSYPEDIKERVERHLFDDDDQGLLTLAGELSSTVYDDHAVHYRMHQLSALIRKYPALHLPDVNPEENALRVFCNAEFRCKWTNRKLSALARYNSGREAPAFHRMRKFINWVLRDKDDVDEEGLGPTPNLPRIYSQSRFTGGASIGVNGSATNIFRKLNGSVEGGWSCSIEAFPHVCNAFWAHAQIQEYVLTLLKGENGYLCYDRELFDRKLAEICIPVRHNKIAFAPKDATILRIVANEPTCNTVPLKGCDIEMRMKLRNVGFDLSDQDSNVALAYAGSRDWDSIDPFCTIDLKSASGMLAYSLVKELLPCEWFELLDSLRSQYYEMPDGTFGRYESFASMGNGSVFPLQTLVFASVCHAIYEELGIAPDFRVYGDDIIVRRSAFDRVVALLRFLGFKPNLKKTFSEGPFRESCGGDFHSGVNVRPVFLDHELDTIERVFGFHNQSLRRGGLQELYFREVREHLIQVIPKPLRFVVPYDPSTVIPKWVTGKGAETTFDCAFWAPYERVMTSKTCFYNRHTWSWGYTILASDPTSDNLDEWVDGHAFDNALLQAALQGSPSAMPFTLRYTTRYKIIRVNRPEDFPDNASFSRLRVGHLAAATEVEYART